MWRAARWAEGDFMPSFALLAAIGLAPILPTAAADAKFGCSEVSFDDEGSIHARECVIPFSSLASEEAKKILLERVAQSRTASTKQEQREDKRTLTEFILDMRRGADEARRKVAEEMTTVFPVTITPATLGGVPVDVVEPKGGVAAQKAKQVLINLHGGGMIFGARYEGQVMSIPIASLGGMKVITVDYRMAPEHRFPAASEDVAAVYKELLKSYSPNNIGMYGCSAGGALTTQSLAWFQAHDLPTPAAAGILGIGHGMAGDSVYAPTTPQGFNDPRFLQAVGLYASEANKADPLLVPFTDERVLKKFPPVLFINSSRDITVSAALDSHRRLVKAGVDSQILVYDGLDHCFMYERRLPESMEAYDLLIKFFDQHLGRAMGE